MSRPFYDRYPFDSETSKEDPLNDRKSWRNTFEGNVMNTNIPPHNSEYPWWFHNWVRLQKLDFIIVIPVVVTIYNKASILSIILV